MENLSQRIRLLARSIQEAPAFPFEPSDEKKKQAPKKWVSAGGVVIPSLDKTEKVYIVKPANNYGPYSFPKGRVDPGESLRQTALREVYEETGMTAKHLGTGNDNYLGSGKGSYSITHFYLMVRTGGTPTPNEEMEEIKLVTWDRAKQYFKNAGNRRDGIIVDRAVHALEVLKLLK